MKDLNDAQHAGRAVVAVTRDNTDSTSVARRAGLVALRAEPDLPSPPRRWGGDVLAYLGEQEQSADPSRIYWCDGLVARNQPGLILGEPKIGKTLVIEDLAVCLAAGLPEFCGRPIYQRARVLLMTREDADDTTRARLWQLARGRGVAHQDFVDWLEIDGTTPLYLDSPEDVTAFKETLARFDVVFIDSLSTVHNGDENLARDMIRVMNAWRDLARITRTAIVLVHHLRKPGEGKMAPGSAGGRILTKSRGSGIIAATARHAVCLADGPADHQLAVKVEGNQEIMPAPFVIERRTGETDGRKWVRHEAVGTELVARELAVAARLDPAIIDVVAASGSDGVLMSALRVQVRSNVPARNNIIAARVAVLMTAGRLERTASKRIRIAPLVAS